VDSIVRYEKTEEKIQKLSRSVAGGVNAMSYWEIFFGVSKFAGVKPWLHT
jgi:hypothetical protein